MADDLTEDQIEKIKQAFNAFDKDGNGTITIDELGDVMSSLGQSSSEEELEEFVQQLGGDDGKVHWEQFLNLMAKVMGPQ